jgi:hypothetical protein
MIYKKGYLVLLVLLFASCAGSKNIRGIIRDAGTNKAIAHAEIVVPNNSSFNGKTFTSDTLGYFEINNSKQHDIKALIVKSSAGSDTIPLSNLISFHYILIKNKTKAVNTLASDKVADMHYHVSMKPHNEFGLEWRTNRKDSQALLAEKGIFWLFRPESEKSFFGLLRPKGFYILHEGKWKNPGRIRRIDADKLNSGNKKERKKFEKLNALYEGRWYRDKKNNNKFYDYTQATLPHLNSGNVKLAFNAISPFEYNLNNTWKVRLFSHLFKSRGKIKWLERIGALIPIPTPSPYPTIKTFRMS